MEVYFRPLRLDAGVIYSDIVNLLRERNAPIDVSVYVEFRIDIEYRVELVISEVSIYSGYALRCISPTAQCVVFDSPFGLCSTSVRREVLRFADDIANNLGGEIALECNVDGVVKSAAGSAIFGIKNRTIYASKSIASVEREMVYDVARSCNFEIIECEITKKELTIFDELFYCNHYGITAISRYDRRTYMSILAKKIADGMTQPWV